MGKPTRQMNTNNRNILSYDCDVLVVGGGPAGSAISALLAEKGWRVDVVEKTPHPRFHIGESLLPHTLPFLERLGVHEQIERIGLRKYGAELVSPFHDKPVTLYFSRAMDTAHPFAYQVRRSEFDEILFKNCNAKGVRSHVGVRATAVDWSSRATLMVHGLDAQHNHIAWQCRFLVDATGRDTFLANQLGLKRRNSRHNSAAIFGHFNGVARQPGKDEGNITIAWFKHGWFWIIPFRDGVTSVGAVCSPSYLKTRHEDLDHFLWSTIAHCPAVAERLRDAKLVVPAMATGNYSYQAQSMLGEHYMIIGDAFAFVDPVFSTGVHLALYSAFRGAEVVDAQLREAPRIAKQRKDFERTVRKTVKLYSWFIYRFTQPAFRFLFMTPRNAFRMEEAVLSVLAGDVFRKTPTRIPLLCFKMAYYLAVLLAPMRNWSAYRQRKERLLVSAAPLDGESRT